MYFVETQLIHRGVYEGSNHERLILHIEFSNPEKHKFKYGPIGTQPYNSFSFNKELLAISQFYDLLDKR